MPRVVIRSDDGQVMLDEHVRASDFESEHFRRCLAERLWWATEDAERQHVDAGGAVPQLVAAA